MRLLRKSRSAAGWLALSQVAGGELQAAVVTRPAGGQGMVPRVELAAAFAASDGLDKVATQLRQRLRGGQLGCSSLLCAGQYQLLALDAPAVPPAELKTAVRWLLKDLLDYHVDDATIDVLAVPAERGAPRGSLFAVAARNSLIQARQHQCAAARLPLSVIDIPEMAQRNIAALLETPGRGLAMLSLDEQGGLLTITADGELYLARRLEVALAELLEENDERRYAAFDKLTLLLQRSLDHVERQFQAISLSRLVLAPSPVLGLADYLGRNLYITVDTADLASLFDVEKAPRLREAAEQQRYFLTLGAALRSEEVVL